MDIYSIIRDEIVAAMTPTLTIDVVSTVSGGWKLEMDDTAWITINQKITIASVVYRVRAFVQDEYLEVTGASAPVPGTFTLPAPHFDYHSHRKVNTERQHPANKNKALIQPLIYMMPVRNTGAKDFLSLYGFEGKPRFFFLTSFDQKNDLIKVHTLNVVNPMRAMASYK